MLRGNLIDRELKNLREIFPDIRRKDFYKLDNGNYCVQLSYITSGKFACSPPRFDILIEFPYNYPHNAPKAWIQKPKIKETDPPHVYGYDEFGHAHICYLRPKKDWHFRLSSADAAILVEIWIATYCRWIKTGQWDWKEAGFLDHWL
jgi:hypothetical protein